MASKKEKRYAIKYVLELAGGDCRQNRINCSENYGNARLPIQDALYGDVGSGIHVQLLDSYNVPLKIPLYVRVRGRIANPR